VADAGFESKGNRAISGVSSADSQAHSLPLDHLDTRVALVNRRPQRSFVVDAEVSGDVGHATALDELEAPALTT
jgi:hypothetical protein